MKNIVCGSDWLETILRMKVENFLVSIIISVCMVINSLSEHNVHVVISGLDIKFSIWSPNYLKCTACFQFNKLGLTMEKAL